MHRTSHARSKMGTAVMPTDLYVYQQPLPKHSANSSAKKSSDNKEMHRSRQLLIPFIARVWVPEVQNWSNPTSVHVGTIPLEVAAPIRKNTAFIFAFEAISKLT